MKAEKIYSTRKPKESLYYYRILENDDMVEQGCYLKFGDAWTSIVKDSLFMDKTIKNIKSTLAGLNLSEIIIAKRFDND